MKGTKEFEDLLKQFEKNFKNDTVVFGHAVERTDMTIKGQYYHDGFVNQLFEMYMLGYSFGKCVER